jgi:hypothetical protein
MQATGMLFLQRSRPLATRSASNEFQLQLFAIDRIGVHQTEAWVLHWTGPEAEAFWNAEKNRLVPGAAIQVQADRPRSHVTRGCAPDIHARITSIEVVAVPEPRRDLSAAH